MTLASSLLNVSEPALEPDSKPVASRLRLIPPVNRKTQRSWLYRIIEFARSWRDEHATVRALEGLNAHYLKDIGIERNDAVEWRRPANRILD